MTLARTKSSLDVYLRDKPPDQIEAAENIISLGPEGVESEFVRCPWPHGCTKTEKAGQ